jgi:hypothetical protein
MPAAVVEDSNGNVARPFVGRPETDAQIDAISKAP